MAEGNWFYWLLICCVVNSAGIGRKSYLQLRWSVVLEGKRLTTVPRVGKGLQKKVTGFSGSGLVVGRQLFQLKCLFIYLFIYYFLSFYTNPTNPTRGLELNNLFDYCNLEDVYPLYVLTYFTKRDCVQRKIRSKIFLYLFHVI